MRLPRLFDRLDKLFEGDLRFPSQQLNDALRLQLGCVGFLGDPLRVRLPQDVQFDQFVEKSARCLQVTDDGGSVAI